jgi:hypothetical protein
VRQHVHDDDHPKGDPYNRKTKPETIAIHWSRSLAASRGFGSALWFWVRAGPKIAFWLQSAKNSRTLIQTIDIVHLCRPCRAHHLFLNKTSAFCTFREFAERLRLPERAANIAQLFGQFGHQLGSLFRLWSSGGASSCTGLLIPKRIEGPARAPRIRNLSPTKQILPPPRSTCKCVDCVSSIFWPMTSLAPSRISHFWWRDEWSSIPRQGQSC